MGFRQSGHCSAPRIRVPPFFCAGAALDPVEAGDRVAGSGEEALRQLAVRVLVVVGVVSDHEHPVTAGRLLPSGDRNLRCGDPPLGLLLECARVVTDGGVSGLEFAPPVRDAELSAQVSAPSSPF